MVNFCCNVRPLMCGCVAQHLPMAGLPSNNLCTRYLTKERESFEPHSDTAPPSWQIFAPGSLGLAPKEVSFSKGSGVCGHGAMYPSWHVAIGNATLLGQLFRQLNNLMAANAAQKSLIFCSHLQVAEKGVSKSSSNNAILQGAWSLCIIALVDRRLGV